MSDRFDIHAGPRTRDLPRHDSFLIGPGRFASPGETFSPRGYPGPRLFPLLAHRKAKADTKVTA
ncbi:hypothetical protein ASE36_10485 [Rhizobium sp. Root274]|nr:hypothetical protein ASC71_10500 [Rhizobium sp. Root1240]KRD29101.1 hypothetical protein ASE36_10485 [Rhizobium sp. Root274]